MPGGGSPLVTTKWDADAGRFPACCSSLSTRCSSNFRLGAGGSAFAAALLPTPASLPSLPSSSSCFVFFFFFFFFLFSSDVFVSGPSFKASSSR